MLISIRRKKSMGCVDGTVNVICYCVVEKMLLFYCTAKDLRRQQREREQSTVLSQVNKQERR